MAPPGARGMGSETVAPAGPPPWEHPAGSGCGRGSAAAPSSVRRSSPHGLHAGRHQVSPPAVGLGAGAPVVLKARCSGGSTLRCRSSKLGVPDVGRPQVLSSRTESHGEGVWGHRVSASPVCCHGCHSTPRRPAISGQFGVLGFLFVFLFLCFCFFGGLFGFSQRKLPPMQL